MAIGVDYYNKLKPVKYNVTDSSLELDSVNFLTQQGNSLIEYNFLLSANDCIIKNYTNNYLTFNYTKEDIFDKKVPEQLNNSLITQMSITSASSTRYLTLVPNGLSSTSQAAITSYNNNFKQELVIDFVKNNNDDECVVWAYDKLYKKYLTIRENNNNSLAFVPSVPFYFKYLYDKETNNINLYYTLSTGQFSWLIHNLTFTNNPVLSVITPSTTYKTNLNFNTTALRDDVSDKTQNFVLYDSEGNVDTVNSIQNIKNNFLTYSPYETWVPKQTCIEGDLKFFNLKNYTSKNNFINRVPYFKDKQQRNYNSIITSDYQEKSNEKLQLGFNFYTKEYQIKPDKYTKFTLPSTIKPFDRININDSGLKESGAYGASSPYFSDRVYKLLDDNINVNTKNESNGIFLCSWLNISDGTWYDRYYIPQNTSYIQALSSPTSQVFNYVNELSSFIQNNNIQSLNFYDIKSSLMFEPSGTYYYARIGNKYIQDVLDGNNSNLVKSTFSTHLIDTGSIIDNQDSITLDGNSYDEANIGDIIGGRFNISFKIKTVDLENTKAYQLIGNNYNLGFSLRKNFYFTPFVIIQQKNVLYFYNTDFELITKNTYDQAAVGDIKDVCYVTQTNDIILRTTTGLYKTDITGQISRSNTSISQGLTGNVVGRYFYGKGNRALFVTNDVTPYPIYITDLQTLNTELSSTSINNLSSVITTSNESIIQLPGTKGINISDSIGVSLSSNKYVLFTDLTTQSTYTGLSTSKIDDINCLNENLFIQSDNKLRIFNTQRELLSTVSLSQSAVEGFKIDFISEDYEIYPIVFSRDINKKILVDKISLSTGKILSTYNLNITAVSGGDFFVNPTGFHFAQNTYKNYEDKLCLTVNLPNTFVVQSSARIWSTYTRDWSAVSPISYWGFNYSTISKLNDNSVIDIIPVDKLYNHIDIDFNLINGEIRVFVNGVNTNTVETPSNLLSVDTILKNILFVGNQNYYTKAITDYVTNQKLTAKGFEMSDFRIYNISLSEDFIKYLYMKGIKVDDINIDFSCDTRNSIETIDNLFTYNIPGRLSNNIKIYIKGIGLTESIKSQLMLLLDDKLKSVMPANINKITYDFNVP